MNDLVVIENGQAVVSSRQVAENFGKNHKDVLRSIRGLDCSEKFAERNFAPSEYKDSSGKTNSEFLITRDGFSFLVMGFTGADAAVWKEKYIYAFNEMDKKLSGQFKLPRDYASALRALADQTERNEEQEKLLIEAKPKVEFYDAVSGSKDAIGIGEVAKVLGISGVGRNNLFSILRDKGILMANNLPYQEFVDRGYFRVIEQKYTKPNGETCISIKTLVYQRGVEYIRKVVSKVYKD